MREIKFRGLDKSGKWRTGNLIQMRDKAWIGSTTALRGWLEVKPNTVGQYTGLKDKHGLEIYEGDILLFNNSHNDRNNKWICVVKYRKGSFVCEYPRDGVYNHFDSWNVPKVTWEVIGNVYENPESLEVAE